MLSSSFYIFTYYTADAILQALYCTNDTSELLSSHPVYYTLYPISSLMLILYSLLVLKNYMYPEYYDKAAVTLSLISIRFLLSILILPQRTLYSHEVSRYCMWIFTSPMIIQMYSTANSISLLSTGIHYHICGLSIILAILPYKNHTFYYIGCVIAYSMYLLYMVHLYKYRHLPFTSVYIYIWILIGSIYIVELSHTIPMFTIEVLYLVSDILIKFTCCIVISSHTENEIRIRDSMDLQSINFISYMIKEIKSYKRNNHSITPRCLDLIAYIDKKFKDKLPLEKNTLKLELLKKILPLDFDTRLFEDLHTNTNANKEYSNLCVLLIDIVSYTELANTYSGETIFTLLNTIYNTFDTILKRYTSLQKIETIGDAYMVVGDLYATSKNIEVVVTEILQIALEFICELKKVSSPNAKPLCCRIGIDIGPVNIGILGIDMPRVCVVGHTVNMASRLQTVAEIDTIQISDSLYQISKDLPLDITYVEKENVYLKNIGLRNTYVIHIKSSI